MLFSSCIGHTGTVSIDKYDISIRSFVSYPTDYTDSCELIIRCKFVNSPADTLVYYPYGPYIRGDYSNVADWNKIQHPLDIYVEDSLDWIISCDSMVCRHTGNTVHMRRKSKEQGVDPQFHLSLNPSFILYYRDNSDMRFRRLYDSSLGVVSPRIKKKATSKDKSVMWLNHSQYGNVIILKNADANKQNDTLMWGNTGWEYPFILRKQDTLVFIEGVVTPYHRGPSTTVVNNIFVIGKQYGYEPNIYELRALSQTYNASSGVPVDMIVFEKKHTLFSKERIHIETLYLPYLQASPPIGSEN